MVYSDEQVDILVTLNVLASTFSFLGAGFIIANFFAFKDFRSNFAFKLILFVAIGDVLNSLGNFLGSPRDESFLCYLQGFLTQFGDIVSFAWVTAIASVIYKVITAETPPTRNDVERWYRRIHAMIWPTTLLLSILPFFSDSYGNDNGLCWITSNPSPWGELWRFLCFYIPLWGSIVYVAIVYYRIWGQLTAPEAQPRKSSDVAVVAHPDAPTKVASTTNTDSPNGDTAATTTTAEVQPKTRDSNSDVYTGTDHLNLHRAQNSSGVDVFAGSGYPQSSEHLNGVHESAEEVSSAPKSGGGTLQRIKFYPFVLFGCYLFATVRRIAEVASDDGVAPFGIAAIQVFTSALLGTCNAILYGFTPVVWEKDSQWIRAVCGCAAEGGKDGGDEQADEEQGNAEAIR